MATAAAPLAAAAVVDVEAVLPSSEPGEEVLLEERATESSNTWLRPDGLLRTELFPAPVNYETATGGFAPIDNELVDSGVAGVAVENAANDYTARLPQDAGSKAVRFAVDGRWVSFQMQGLDGAPVVEGTEATYTQVQDAAEVTYEATSAGLKESVVLEAAPVAPVSYVFDLSLSVGLTPQLTAANSIEVLDGQGTLVFAVPAPFMVDSASPEPAHSTEVDFDLAPAGTGWVLTMTPDQGWLADPARVFPVVVDPTITDGEVTRDCTLNKAQPTDSFCGDSSNRIKVGYSGGNARRGILRFDVEELPANNITVTNAEVKLYLDSGQSTAAASPGPEYVARRLTEGWTNTATWNSRWTGQAWASAGGTFTGSGSGLNIVGNNDGYKSIPATGVVNGWLGGGANQGLIVKQASPEDTSSLLWFYSSASSDSSKWPKLEVTYTDSSGVSASGAGDRSYFTYASEKLTDRMQAKANVGSGNLLLGVSDLNIAGVAGLDFSLTRTYNSVLDDGSTTGGDLSGMGPGWSHNLGGSVRLEFPSGTNRVLFHGPSGYRVRFEKNINGDYFAVAPGLAGSTLKSITGGYELTFRDKQVYKFTTGGQLSEIRDKQGNKLQMTYLTSGADTGKLDYVTDTRSRKIDFFYTSGLLTSVEVRSPAPANTLLLTYTYTYAGSPSRLASSAITQVASSLVATAGDGVNVNSNGNIKTTYEYANGRLATVKDARENAPNSDHAGGTTTFGYHTSGAATGKIQTITRGTDDDQSRVIPDSVTTFTYPTSLPSNCNSQGSTATQVNGERLSTDVDDTTTYCVDDKFRVERTVDAKGHVRKQTWTSQSNVETFDASGLSAGGNTFTYSYDDSDNPTKVTTPTGGSAGATYTDTANPTFPTSMSDFDTGGSSASPTWAYDYDDKGNLIQAKADLDTGTGDDIEYRYCWDGDGQLTRIDPIGTAGSMSSGSLDTNTSADGCDASGGQANDTLYAYNTNKELASINAPAANRDVSYTYDALSRIKTVTDGRGVVTTFTYDALDHVVAQDFTDNNTDTVTRIGDSTASVEWTYDESGNRTKIDNNDGNPTTFVYDELNRVIGQSQTSPANAMEFFYDPADNLTKFDDEHDPTLYTYDAVNLVTSIDDPRTNATGVTAETNFTYDRHDKRVKTTFYIDGGNPLVERAKYNDGGQPICIYSYRLATSPLSSSDEAAEEPPCPSAETSGLITFFRYDYTAPGGFETSNKYKTTTKGKVTWNYTYDPISRLEQATHREGWDTGTGTPMRKYEYTYDRHSNLVQEKRSGSSFSGTSYLDMAYNTSDEMCWSRDSSTAATGTACTDTPTGRFTYAYDGAGALATATDSTGTVTPMTLGYNVIGQTAQADPFGGAVAFDMAYVGVTQDRRVEKDDLNMSYGFSGLSSQAPNSGTVHSEYFVRDPGGRLVAMIDLVSTNPDRYYLMDDQQSVMATVEADDGVVRRYLYEPFGEEARASWTDPNPGSNNNGTVGGVNAKPVDGSETTANETDADYNNWRFASGYYDPETNLIKYGTRYYMPNLARWTQTDPQAGKPQQPLTLNPYLYAGQNPANKEDRTGRYWGEDTVEDAWDSATSLDSEDLVTIGTTVAIAGLVVAATGGIGLAGGGAIFGLVAGTEMFSIMSLGAMGVGISMIGFGVTTASVGSMM